MKLRILLAVVAALTFAPLAGAQKSYTIGLVAKSHHQAAYF